MADLAKKSSPRVLVVEDEALIALELKRRLERLGYEVTATVGSAEEALNSVRLTPPDVVLMDIRLRGSRDGVEAADELRREYGLPVLFVTAHADRATLERARRAEPFGYIVKPFTSTNFEPKIEMAIWKNAMEQKIKESEQWLSQTLQHAGDGIITTDRSGRVATVNPAGELLIAREAQQTKGLPIWDVLPLCEPHSGIRLEQSDLEELLCEGGSRIAVVSTGDVVRRTIECTIAVSGGRAATFGLIVVLRDISHRVFAAQQELNLRKTQALSQLAGAVAGQLRQPIQSISVNAEQALSETAGGALPELRRIYRESVRAGALVSQLAELAETKSRDTEYVDVPALLERLQPRIRRVLGRRQTLRLIAGKHVPKLLVERPRLTDSILTLADSAARQADASGAIELAVTGELSGTVRIAFFGESAAASSPPPGTGTEAALSLSFVEHFAAVNHGALESSKSGSSFSIGLSFSAQTQLEDAEGMSE